MNELEELRGLCGFGIYRHYNSRLINAKLGNERLTKVLKSKIADSALFSGNFEKLVLKKPVSAVEGKTHRHINHSRHGNAAHGARLEAPTLY